jgi:exopolysaccharide biosynthesis polyprenyl glycosylphosphotransferase
MKTIESISPVELQKVGRQAVGRVKAFRATAALRHFVIDIVCVLLSFYFAYLLRFDFHNLTSRPISSLDISLRLDSESFQTHLAVALSMAAFLLFSLFQKRIYALESGVRHSQEFSSVLSGTAATLAFGIIISFLFKRFVVSRLVLTMFSGFVFLSLFGWRFLRRKSLQRLYAQGRNCANVLIVGGGTVGKQVKALLDASPWLGLSAKGFLDDRETRGATLTLGRLEDFQKVITQEGIDEVYITIPWERDRMLELARSAYDKGVTVKVIPELFNLLTCEMQFETLGSFTVAKLFRPTLTPQQRFIKRIEDILVAGLLSLVFGPICAIVALMVKLSSRGPAIFRQTRIGEGGKPFTVYKFRSMYSDNDDRIHREYVSNLIKGNADAPPKTGAIYKMVDDPRVTPIGKFIRKFHLDELPQLWNVLKGDLSLVGPRPPLAYEYEQYEEFFKKRLLIKPGITGLWQVSGKYRVGFEQMVMLDIRYISEWSFWLDMRILLETVPQMLKGGGI